MAHIVEDGKERIEFQNEQKIPAHGYIPCGQQNPKGKSMEVTGEKVGELKQESFLDDAEEQEGKSLDELAGEGQIAGHGVDEEMPPEVAEAAKPVCEAIDKVMSEQAEQAPTTEAEEVKHSDIGKTVIVYDRYHFAVPLRGKIQDVAPKEGAYKVSFFSKQPGYPNYLKMDNKYFFAQQCKIVITEEEIMKPVDFKEGIFGMRSDIELVKSKVKNWQGHPSILGIKAVEASESYEHLYNIAEAQQNLILAYRHLEDARMRLGKCLQSYDGGKSCYPR